MLENGFQKSFPVLPQCNAGIKKKKKISTKIFMFFFKKRIFGSMTKKKYMDPLT
jgi:hypothetical protein